MSEIFPSASSSSSRHGETEWTNKRAATPDAPIDRPLNGAGRTPPPRALRPRLAKVDLRRSIRRIRARSCERVETARAWPGFATPVLLAELQEWDYGDYEGRTTTEKRSGSAASGLGSVPRRLPTNGRGCLRRGRQRADMALEALSRAQQGDANATRRRLLPRAFSSRSWPRWLGLDAGISGRLFVAQSRRVSASSPTNMVPSGDRGLEQLGDGALRR